MQIAYELIEKFVTRFGARPTHAAVAPGRVNLIGEHTDYNDGFCLPMAIDRRATLLARVNEAKPAQVRVASTAMTDVATFDATQPLTPGEPAWANYIKGPIAGCARRGLTLPNVAIDVLLDATVPPGSGLSSSAAIEVATATLVEAITNQIIDPIEKALLCQQAEHDFAGVPCGIMDQFISALGQADHVVLIDCRSHQTKLVAMDDPSVSVLILHSRVSHALADGEYAKRRADCEEAARTLGVEALRDVTSEQLEASCEKLSERIYRRARHVIAEIARTLEAAEALDARDYVRFGELMIASHNSLRDDYEVSCEELDLLVEMATRESSVFGSRMTGGGFGGCTVTLVATEQAEVVRDKVCRAYHEKTGLEPLAFISRPTDGARVVPIT